MRVLVADDDPITREVLLAILSDLGECRAVPGGASAVAAFETAQAEGRPFDLVCLDILMPDLDGQAVLRRIRDIEEEHGGQGAAKALMITAVNDPKNVVDAFHRGGAAGYLTKPVDRDMLMRTLANLELTPPKRPAADRPRPSDPPLTDPGHATRR